MLQFHTNCDAQYSGRKPETSVQLRVHPTAESHFVILTVIALQYVSVVVQEPTSQPWGRQWNTLSHKPHSAVLHWSEEMHLTLIYYIFVLWTLQFLIIADSLSPLSYVQVLYFFPLSSPLFLPHFLHFSIYLYLLLYFYLQVGPERKCVLRVTVREATCVWRHLCALLPLVCECQMALWQPTQLLCWLPMHHPRVC